MYLAIKRIVVNFILLFTFEKVNLNKNLCIMLLYKHILTLKSIDKHMSILDFYTINNKKSIINLKK